MDILILHNPRAGKRRLTKARLVRALARAGHRVRYRSTRGRMWKHALVANWDVVVAAGGDGTVAQVAIALAQRRIKVPLAIIPTGAANNIARALNRPERTQLAVCSARGSWARTYFVESAGVGPMASLMIRKAESLRHGLERLRRALQAARTRTLRIRADGKDLSGEYLMAQVLNINAIGPRVELAARADPGDERLELLLIKAEQRTAFAAYLVALARGRDARCPLPVTRARRIDISGWPARDGGQLDDQTWPDQRRPAHGKVRIMVETRLPVLVLQITRPRRRAAR